MATPETLFLYEEIMLLALRDEKGTFATAFADYAVAGAVLAELSLAGRIRTDGTRKALVELVGERPMGDPIIDECLERLAAGKRRASLQTWVTRLAGLKDLRHKVARRLCDRGILRADESRVLLVFKRKDYPEVNPVPERRILERLRAAIFSESGTLDPRTVVLVSLAHGTDLLKEAFGRREVKERRKRIEQIVSGELTGKATKEVIEACQAAVIAAATAATVATSIAVSNH